MTMLHKKLTGVFGVALFLGAALGARPAQAGHREWETAGKILTGVVAMDFLFNHLPAVAYQRPVVCAAPAPWVAARCAPVVMRPPPRPIWHAEHYIYVPRSVWVDTSCAVDDWVPGCRRVDGVWVNAHRIRRIVPSGYWATTQDRVWVAAGGR